MPEWGYNELRRVLPGEPSTVILALLPTKVLHCIPHRLDRIHCNRMSEILNLCFATGLPALSEDT